ncbi:MAG: transposase [Candidatus Kapabacteria bacterium]|nr:transposase [Candidatus Kapabacteria bacterium]
MPKQRVYTEEQRRAILKEADENGVAVTVRKYGIATSMIYKWRDRVAKGSPKASRETEHELQRLRQEVRLLKELVAEKELALRIKDSLLKKTLPRGSSE